MTSLGSPIRAEGSPSNADDKSDDDDEDEDGFSNNGNDDDDEGSNGGRGKPKEPLNTAAYVGTASTGVTVACAAEKKMK